MNPMHRSSSYGLSGASIRLLLTAGLCMLAAVMYAAPGEKEESFDVGQFVFEHIQDAHSWHICKIGGKDIAIPLPVLVYSKQTGWHAFMSSRLREGAEWKGFFIEEEGDEAGKLLERLPDGSTHRPGLDLSITKNVCAIFISIALLLAIFLSMARVCAGRRGKAPKGLQNMMETVILFIRDEVAIPSIGKEKYEAYMPYLLTIFFFILVNNLMGLLPIFPGGANVTGNIAVTLSLALFTFLMTNIKSTKTYWKDIVNTPGAPVWLKLPIPIMPVVEIIGIFTKPFVLMVRLFANITAGHMVIMTFFSLIFVFGIIRAWLGFAVASVSIAFTIFMTFLELLVAFIQAYVFTALSAVYFGMSAIEEETH